MMLLQLRTRILCAVILVLPFAYICSQSVEQDIIRVKHDNAFYWGEGVGKTASLADEQALAMLIGSISANVESNFSVHTTEVTDNKKTDFKQYVQGIVKTYSNATIKNTEIRSWGEEPHVHVFRYVKKTEVYKIFAERTAKITAFVKIALQAEQKYQVADALRYYYWALMMLQSHPEANSMSMEVREKNVKLDVFIPQKINEIFEHLTFYVDRKLADGLLMHYALRINYKKHPATNCEYSFFDGRNWSFPVNAKDGLGSAEMFGDTTLFKEIRLKIEYAFENEWKIDSEVNDVLRKVEPVIFKKSYVTVSLQKSEKLQEEGTQIGRSRIKSGMTEESRSTSDTIPPADKRHSPFNALSPSGEGHSPSNDLPPAGEERSSSNALSHAGKGYSSSNALPSGEEYSTSDIIMRNEAETAELQHLALLEKVENAIISKNYETVRTCFTEDGYDVFTRLVAYGNAVIIDKPAYSFTHFEDGILARALPMKFSFSNNRRTFVENVVFNISRKEGKIQAVAFALENQVYGEIMEHQQWKTYSQLAIIQFIENYKTAYALKRLDFIESIFSDHALIIVGKVVQNYNDPESKFDNTMVKLTKYSKEQYVKQLAHVFQSNEFVNLHFTDVNVKKAGVGGEIYGIQLKQDYFSTSYGDTGYLFLMVDLNNTDQPIIHIRTWQTEKDPHFGVYDISNF